MYFRLTSFFMLTLITTSFLGEEEYTITIKYFLPCTRDAPELGFGRLVPAGTKIFESSGSGRN